MRKSPEIREIEQELEDIGYLNISIEELDVQIKALEERREQLEQQGISNG